MKRTAQDDQGGQSDSLTTTRVDATSDSTISLPDNSFVSDAKILQDGHDLILRASDGDTVIVENYFLAEPTPVLTAVDGAALTPELVNAFVKPADGVQFAQQGTLSDVSPVGLVSEASGEATIIRMDGSTTKASIGTPVFQGDVVETSGNGAVNIRFVDDTSFSVSDNARLSIDEYVFDPATQSGETGFSVLRGVFMFTSGLIGRDDPDAVTIDTPVGSIGIRGTIILGDIKTAGESKITVVEGAIVVRNDAGEQTLSQQYETVTLSGMSQGMTLKGVLSADQIANDYNVLRSVSADLFSTVDDNQKSDPAQQDSSPAEPEKRGDAPQTDNIQEATLQATGSDLTETLNEQADAAEETSFLTGEMLSFEEHFDTGAGLRDIADVAGTGDGLIHDNPASGAIASTASGLGLSGGTTAAATALSPATTNATAPSEPAASPAALDNLASGNTAQGDNGGGSTPPVPTPILNLNDIISGVETSSSVTYIPSTATGSQHGSGLTALGDFNGSGFDNYAFHNGNGRIFIDRDSGNVSTINLQGTPYYIANAGMMSISGAGDFNGDGQMDLIVGTPLDGASANGSVRIITNASINTYVTVTGFAADETAGYSVGGIGDFNGDGFSDVIIGAPDMASTGSFYVVFGNNSGTTIDVSTFDDAALGSYGGTGFKVDGGSGSQLGKNVAGIGDHDGDGFDDFIVSLPNDGQIKIYYGRASDSALTTADSLTINGVPETTGSNGIPVIALGDTNGNGRSDIAIADYEQTDTVYIYRGDVSRQSGTVSLAGADAQISAGGHTLVGAGSAGDFNGDGTNDIAVAFRNGSMVDIFVIYGGNLNGTIDPYALSDDAVFHMQLNLDSPQFSLTDPATDPVRINLEGAGDLNGDGLSDLLIGLPDLLDYDGGVVVVRGRPEQGDLDNNSITYDTTATASNQALAGTTGADTFDLGTFSNVSALAGAGNDIINVSNASGFGTLHGGGGIDTLNFLTGTGIDLREAGNRIHDIEILRIHNSSQTIDISIDDIFRLLQESDNNTLRFETTGGGNLNIDSNGQGGWSLATLGFTDNGASGGYQNWSFGGYTLMIDQTINAAVV